MFTTTDIAIQKWYSLNMYVHLLKFNDKTDTVVDATGKTLQWTDSCLSTPITLHDLVPHRSFPLVGFFAVNYT